MNDDDRIFSLYEKSVQNPEHEVFFIDRVFDQAFGRAPLRLREDFSGTAAVSRAFVRSDDARRAMAVDIDARPLEWCRARQLSVLSTHVKKRLTLRCADVMDDVVTDDEGAQNGAVDVVYAGNFSYLVFVTEASLTKYFSRVHERLANEGVFVIDVLGGRRARVAGEIEDTKFATFTTHFRTVSFDEATRRVQFAIDFSLVNGERLENAFVYDWCLYPVATIERCLHDAGFVEVKHGVETRDVRGRATGNYVIGDTAPDAGRSVSYLIGIKRG